MNTSLLFGSYPFITAEKVTLSRMTDMDLEALWSVLGDEKNFRYAPTGALSSPALCPGRLFQYEAMFHDRVAIVLGIYPGGGGSRLGGIFEIYNVDPLTQSVTVRFTLSQRYTRQGYASAALRAAVDYLTVHAGVHRIQAYVMPGNDRGILVLERCGFVREGLIREGFFWPDKGIVDLCLYSLLPTDLQGSIRDSAGEHVF